MTGLTILDTYTVFAPYEGLVILMVFLGILAVVGLFLVLDDDFCSRIVVAFTINCAICALFLFISLMCEASFMGKQISHYKVILDESVKYIEFVDKYEIYEQEGKILDVIEKMKRD